MNIDQVVTHRGSNAYLAYTRPAKAGRSATIRVYNFWLEIVEQAHEMRGDTRQSQLFQHFYSRSYSSGPLRVTGRVKTQERYDQLAEFIHDHQLLMITDNVGGSNALGANVSLPLMRLGIPKENLYYSGWIGAFTGGAKRFNPAPQFNFDYQVVADKHSTNDLIIPSYQKRVWFSGSFLDGPVYQKPTKEQIEKADVDAVTDEIGNRLDDIFNRLNAGF